MLGVSPDVNSSTPLKQGQLTRKKLFPMDHPPVAAPTKRIAIVAFIVDESSEDLVGASRLTKVIRSDFGLSDKTVTYVGGVSTVIGLADIDAIVGQCVPSGQAGPS